MTQSGINTKKMMSKVLMSVFVVVFVLFGSVGFIKDVNAQVVATNAVAKAAVKSTESACTGLFPCVGKGLAEAWDYIWEGVTKPAAQIALYKSAFDIMQYAADKVAYEAATLIANGGIGKESLFYKKSAGEAAGDFGLEFASKVAEEIQDATKEIYGGEGFNVCAPTSPIIRLNLAISIKQQYKPGKPRCDIKKVVENWTKLGADAYETFTDTDARNKFLLKTAESALKPGSNDIGAYVGFSFMKENENKKKQEEAFWTQITSMGFKNAKNVVTGNIETPSSLIQTAFNRELVHKKELGEIPAYEVMKSTNPWGALAASTWSTFSNTLGSTLLKNIYEGLLKSEPEPFKNLFDFDGVQTNNENRYSSLKESFSSIPISLANYDITNEFTTCTPGVASNRGLNQCVMNTDFKTAVTHGIGGYSLTLREAMSDEFKKLIDGSFLLYSPEDAEHNQDPNCQDYGFCYGNLVKMRKARIIPIGWELAALKSPVNNPVTLKEVVDGFDKCDSTGSTNNNENKWCHLIDPNWVLKVPESQCDAVVNSEIRMSPLSPGRQSVCADTPSCIGEDSKGNCSNGFGYCVKEKNIWRIKGDECPEQFATCLTLKDTESQKQASYLVNTVDYSVCNKSNAGCQWYRTQKYLNSGADAVLTSDDTYTWLAGDEKYVTADHEKDYSYQLNGVPSARKSYSYNSPPALKQGYSVYSYEDRVYFNHSSEVCSKESVGCTKLLKSDGRVSLNLVQNGSFEIDDDKDGKPDNWVGNNVSSFVSESTNFGSLVFKSQSILKADQTITVKENSFYTLSAYALAEGIGFVYISPLTIDGKPISVQGLSYGGDCYTPSVGAQQNDYAITIQKNTDWKRVRCTFTTPKTTASLKLSLYGIDQTSVLFDAVQLEVGEKMNEFFSEGYIGLPPTPTYLKLSPKYYGCSGSANDPEECKQFTQVCQAQDVGCNLYSPDDGDPSIPAIISDLDTCPSECVGYDSYRQEPTDYDSVSPKDPFEHFIPAKATSCSSLYAGCDSFTNISDSESGGETQEYYTKLRSCLTEQMADVSEDKKSAVFFTWEGSDNLGYQLRTWNLLESNATAEELTLSNGNKETNPGLAPCVNSEVKGGTEVVCTDENVGLAVVAGNKACDEHSDVLKDPKCREFFDKNGNVHYREYAQTISVDNECKPYRKNTSEKADCDASGGYWTDQGFCRYFGLQKESLSCPSTQNGCREYTGGAGRNAITILKQDFEGGTVPTDFNSYKNGILTPSNESIISGGKSLRVRADSKVEGGFITSGKLLDANIQAKKTFVVEFWAKGNGKLFSAFVDKGGLGATHDFGNKELSGSWQVYKFGPLDTSATSFSDFGSESELVFYTDKGKEFFIDNLTLKQVEENIAIIKNSWVVPSSCDQTKEGKLVPQKYLGCEAYSDQNSTPVNLYQFSSLCSEKVVGCKAFFNTQNSDSVYAQVNNARCVYSTNNNLADGEKAPSNMECEVFGKTYCTIIIGREYCTFNAPTAFANPLPFDQTKNPSFGIVYGPETVVVQGDNVEYLVDKGDMTCSEQMVGCTEVGLPTYSQDKKTVTGFASKYVLNNPNTYKDTLCNNEELFCEEFASNKDGNFYFKDPGDKTCEYKTSVKNGNKSMFGWFKTGTTEPCDPTHVSSGNKAEIWRNGDKGKYDGWVGQCDNTYDKCSELLDVVDTGGDSKKGSSYFVVNNEKLTGKGSIGSANCDGSVGQKAGCALFNNTTISDLKYNAGASYVLSTHSDLFVSVSEKGNTNELVLPVSCTTKNNSIYTVTPSAVTKLKLPQTVDLCERRCKYKLANGDKITTPSAVNLNATDWLERSCLLDSDCPELVTQTDKKINGTCGDVAADKRLLNDTNTILKVARDRTCGSWVTCDSSKQSWNEQTNRYESVCDSIRLCSKGSVKGDKSSCEEWEDSDPRILTEDLYSSRDINWTGYEYSGYSIPNQLPVEIYDQFNVNPEKWCQKEDGSLQGDKIISCSTDKDCVGLDTCESAKEDYRLVYNAGACDSDEIKRGDECRVGFCKGTGEACSGNKDCNGKANSCVIGYCQAKNSADINFSCSADVDCKGKKSSFDLPTEKCVAGTCVDVNIKTDIANRKSCASVSDCVKDQKCIPSATSVLGACYNDRCVADIGDFTSQTGSGARDGFADPLDTDKAQSESCRGYPEIDSPFPNKIVTKWEWTWNLDYVTEQLAEKQSVENIGNPKIAKWAKPAEFVSGFDQSKVCAPDKNGKVSDECLCTYKKVEYGANQTRYYPEKTTGYTIEPAVCVGGLKEGQTCKSDDDCDVKKNKEDSKVVSSGKCEYKTKSTLAVGWKGYCIEKDTSIQINGSNKPEDRACLTWLPVDQLTGSTDLYGKYTTAGFTAEDTFYCADVGLAHDVGTSGVACAEWQPYDQCDDLEESWRNCAAAVNCPKGHFAVMTACNETDSASAKQKACNETLPADDDCPYFCVPDNSYKTSTEDSCDNPAKSSKNFKVLQTVDNAVVGAYKIYAMSADVFDTAYNYYKDCLVSGVLDKDIGKYVAENTKPNQLQEDNDFYWGMKWNYTAYPACSSLVKVGNEELTDNTYNVAWTNRLWKNGGYVIKDAPNNKLLYAYTRAQSPFGVSLPVETLQSHKDVPLARIVTCTSNNGRSHILPNADGTSCSDKYEGPKNPGGNAATAYLEFEVKETLSTQIGYYWDYSKLGDVSEPKVGVKSLSQLFAKSYSLYKFYTFDGVQKTGKYKVEKLLDWDWDVRPTGDNYKTPTPPQIMSIGECVGTQCTEKEEGKFSINGRDGEDVVSDNSVSVSASFYMKADSDQMPIRKVLIDWGDGKGIKGSQADGNFYKNNRGINAVSKKEICDGSDFGRTPEACSSSYVTFTHDYVCSENDLSKLSKCEIDLKDGRLKNSPCLSDDTFSCQFQPKVYVEDNWGWCTGFCPGGEDGTEGCFQGKEDECEYKLCPGDKVCNDNNPWVNYDGKVIVTPKK